MRAREDIQLALGSFYTTITKLNNAVPKKGPLSSLVQQIVKMGGVIPAFITDRQRQEIVDSTEKFLEQQPLSSLD